MHQGFGQPTSTPSPPFSSASDRSRSRELRLEAVFGPPRVASRGVGSVDLGMLIFFSSCMKFPVGSNRFVVNALGTLSCQ